MEDRDRSKTESETYIDAYIARARGAQAAYAFFSQDLTDAAVRAAAKVVFDHAEPLARMAVEETGMGCYEDKVLKNRNKAKMIWHSLKGKKSRGVIERNEETGVTKLAKPVGTVAAITPCTNPVVTPMSNIMFALKGGNAIIITPHHKAIRSSAKTVELINAELDRLGLPRHLVQILDEQSRENTRNLIARADVVIATGGAGMVKAAYASGKPALGVGAGNVQCIVADDADMTEAVSKIIPGRAFDHGIICSGEQAVIVSENRAEEALAAFEAQGAFVLRDEKSLAALRAALFPDGVMNRHAVGQSPEAVAKLAGLKLPPGAKIIVAACAGAGSGEPLAKEKMCPVLAFFPARDFADAVEIARANLEVEGKGHSVSIHSNDVKRVEYAAERLSASRFLVNQVCATSAGGSFQNGLAPTNTLGCGSWGGNSLSENLTYTHLINISSLAYHRPDNPIPTDEEIWN